MKALVFGNLVRVSKTVAKRKFRKGEEFVIVANKMRVGPPWNCEQVVTADEIQKWRLEADAVRNNPTLWKGSLLETAWNLFYNNWSYYNTSVEQGHYGSYYITK